jgi:hypothetical protein
MSNSLCLFFFRFSALLIFLSISNLPDVRYVSKTGTSQFPYTSWATASDSIQKCIDISISGDTIYVGNGTYKENLLIIKRLALIGSSMDSTIVDGRGMRNNTIEFDSTGSIENFNVYGKGYNIPYTAAIWILKNNTEVKYCRASNAAESIGIFNSLSHIHDVIVTNSNNGLDCGCYDNSCINLITNSLIYFKNSYSTGINAGGGGDIYIQNNLIIYEGNDPRHGISLGWPRRVYISNTLISGFNPNVFIDLLQDTVFILNNIVYGGSIHTEYDNVVLKNNIIENNYSNAFEGSKGYVVNNYNIFWKNVSDLYGVIYGDSDKVVDPMFVNDTIPTLQPKYDFHLQAFSPGIRRGDPSILNNDGTRSDIGMYGGPLGETYSYQDLAPRPPVNLSAVVDSNRITLKWNKNKEADTAWYNVYRDTTANFILDSTKLISKQKDTNFVQPIPPNAKQLYYKLTAEDKTGHVSVPSGELTLTLNSIKNNYSVINDYLLYQSYPNPFNPTTVISFNLKEKSYVKLIVYDIKGELIKVLVNEIKESGYYETEFNAKGLASGIYLYRLEVIGKGNIPVYSDMKKTILLK